MTKQYHRTDLYYVWIDHTFDLPDDYVVPLTEDGGIDFEQFDSDSWNNRTLEALDKAAWDRTREALHLVPGFMEQSFEDSQEESIIDTDNPDWPYDA